MRSFSQTGGDRPKSEGQRGGDGVKRLVAALIRKIIHGELSPGHKISEPELSRELNASRGLLREAIRWLEAVEVIQRIPNSGPRVAVFEAHDIVEFYEAREGVEGLAARLAATNMTDDELAALRAHLERVRDTGKGHLVELGVDGDVMPDFHALIVRGSKNRWLGQMLEERTYLLMSLWQQQYGWIARGNPASRRDHFRILEALENRDPECAELLMRRHIARLRQEFIDQLVQEAPGRGGPTTVRGRGIPSKQSPGIRRPSPAMAGNESRGDNPRRSRMSRTQSRNRSL